MQRVFLSVIHNKTLQVRSLAVGIAGTVLSDGLQVLKLYSSPEIIRSRYLAIQALSVTVFRW